MFHNKVWARVSTCKNLGTMAACRYATCDGCNGNASEGSCRCHWTCICHECQSLRSEGLRCDCYDCQRDALNNCLNGLPSWVYDEFLDKQEDPVDIAALCESILSRDRSRLEEYDFTEIQIQELQDYARLQEEYNGIGIGFHAGFERRNTIF